MRNEQPAGSQTFYYLEICCKLAGEKFGKQPIHSWTNSDYLKFSSILSRYTSVQLSPSTLKRIFGKLKTPERYYPQKATRDALAKYAGYKDWDDLVVSHPPPPPETPKTPETPETPKTDAPPQPSTTIKPRRPRGLTISIAVILITGIAIVLWQWQKTSPTAQPTNIHLVCNNPDGQNPHTANFHISLPAGSPDLNHLTVNFGDHLQWLKVPPSRFLSHYFEVPGRYYVTLRYDTLTLDTATVYLKTNGWTATSNMLHDTTRVYPLDASIIFKQGALHVTPGELHQAGIDTLRTFFVNFDNIFPTTIDGDNFEFTTDVTTSPPRPGVRCSQLNILIYGEKTRHRFIIVKPGCEQWSDLQLSDIQKHGVSDDLGFLGGDLSGGGSVSLKVIHKKATLSIDGKQVYSGTYHYPLKKVYGVSIAFSGIGSVNKFSLKDLSTGEAFPGSIP